MTRKLTKAAIRQEERRQAEIRRQERLLAPTATSGGWLELLNPDPFARRPRKPNQQPTREEQRTPQYDWEGTGADDLIDQWFIKYGSTLPRRPAQGNATDLIKEVKDKFVGKRCPKDTTIKDRIYKHLAKIGVQSPE